MTNILALRSEFGPIYIEVDEKTAKNAAVQQDGEAIPNGATPMSSENDKGVLKLNTHFEKAMISLRAYAGSVQKVVAELDVMPKEVSVEVGLKFAFEAGAGFFAIAKAGTEADMKVSLTWEPRKGSGE